MPSLAERLPQGRVVIDVSLWSADLGALTAEIERLTPYADLFHLDASDTQFVPDPLFFPDMLAALRPATTVPFHVHLMAQRATVLAHRFAAAGADLITVHAEADDTADAITAIGELGKAAGVAVRLDTNPEAAMPYLDDIEAVAMIGTPLGTKGSSMDPGAPDRIRALRNVLVGRPDLVVFADGGIRCDTVPALVAAGTRAVVVGSLLLASSNLAATARWLHQLSGAAGVMVAGASP
ncbi:MAG: ribulose-phosphate 3-epimerase [Actinobacteria bacterium]|nr:ribulose-phosphate 3-epimerase [Actinomycetota bacterium]MBI3687426.1 ribulose-phosphate 3-epimerase [Actinomycetota bacterium]